MADWQCSRGGECCRVTSFVEVTQSELDALRAARPDVSLEIRPGHPQRDTVEFTAGPCPYLGESGGCTVYEVRPWRCRAWSCFRKPGQAYSDVVMYERLGESAGVRRLWNRHLADAKPWAEQHGWSDFYHG